MRRLAATPPATASLPYPFRREASMARGPGSLTARPKEAAKEGRSRASPLLLGVVDQVQAGGLQAGEGHIQLGPLDVGPGQLIFGVVPPVSQAVHGGTAGIADAQHPGHLVEALPGGVVPVPPSTSISV